MSEVEIGGAVYQIGHMDTFKQFHVARRLAPVLGGLAKAFGGAGEGAGFTEPLAAIGPLANVIAEMEDADVNYVLSACLKVVARKGPTGFVPVQAQSGALMFEDIDMAAMLQLVFKVLEANLARFFSALPSISAKGPDLKA